MSPSTQRAIGVAAVVLAGCASPRAPVPGVPAGGAGGGGSAPAAASGDMAQQVEALVNHHRARLGCPALQWDARAAAAAQAHSEDMARRNYFAHVSPDGRSPVDRLRAQGVAFRAVAENIAYGQPTAQAVVQGWLASPGHRQNIENCVYTRDGVGYSNGRWTHDFYAPA